MPEFPMIIKNIMIDAACKNGFNPVTTKGKKIIVIHEYETAMAFALFNSVTYVTDDINKKQMFDMMSAHGCGDDDSSILIEDKSEWNEKIKELKNMKFDACIMNPPYSGDLHLNILKAVIDNKLTDIIVDISPIVKIVSKRLKFTDKVKSYAKFSPMFKFIQSVDRISYEEFEKLFGAKPQNEMGITVYNLNKPDPEWSKDKYCHYAADEYSKMSEEEFLAFRAKAGL